MDAQHSAGTSDTNQTEMDNEVFAISSFNDNLGLRSRNNHNITVATGSLYGDSSDGSTFLNLEKSPARILKQWGTLLRTCLNQFITNYITFQKAEELTRLVTEIPTDNYPVADCLNVKISDLEQPFLAGKKIKFTSPFGINEILNLQGNPFGLIQVWDYINNVWRYGWVEEVSSEPIDKITNWELTMCNTDYIQPIARKWKIKMLNGKYIQLLNGGDVLLINQN
jgi:hypothetical protein